MKYNICIVLGIAVISLMTSCSNFFETTVNLPTPEHEPVLAISAYISNMDEGYSWLNINKSYNLFETEPDDQMVDDATVELFENGELLYTYEPPTGPNPSYSINYENIFDGIGNTYELRVNHPDFGSFSATQVMPDTVPLNSIELKRLSANQFGEQVSTVEINFDDPAGVENYYEVALFAVVEYENETYEQPFYFDEENETVGERGLDYSTVFLTDRNFDGQNYTFKPQFYDYYSGNEEEDVTYRLLWRSVTKEYYLYSTSLYKNRNAENNPFAEPVSVYTNFDGAVGAFCLRAGRVYPFEE